MNKVEIFSKKVIELVCRECNTDPKMIFSSNKEKCVDARGIVITVLTEYKISECVISELTGLTQQAVNRLKNIYPDRIRHHFFLLSIKQQIIKELTATLQQDIIYTKDL